MTTYPESLDAAVNSAADAARASIAAAGLVGSSAGAAIDAYVSSGGSVVARKSTLPLNALEYGATGDGSTDDTAALQAWLNAAVSTRRAAYLPRGRYKITASLTVSLTDATKWQGGVRIYGDGSGFAADGTYSGSVLEPTNAVTDAALVVTGVANTDNSNKGMVDGLTVQDLGIRGVSGGTNGHGIRVKYLTNATFRNLKIAYCQSGIKIERQANGATYGYANSIQIENLHAVVNRGYGIEAADAGAICGMTVRASNFGSNTLGGIKIASAPATLQGNIYTGNVGPALLIVAPTGASQATGPTMVGEHFETNSTEATSDYSTSSAQVVIESAQCPRFIGCNWLGGNGAHDIKAGHTAGTVTGLTMVGGSHTGKLANTYQTVLVVGSNLSRCNIQDTEAYNYRGSSSRATSAQMAFTTAGVFTYAHLSAGAVVNGATSASNGVATVAVDGSTLPLGTHAYFETSSQGGSVYASGLLRRSHDGGTFTVQQVAASADCTITAGSGALRLTQTNTSTLALYWSLQIVRTL